MLIKTKKLNIQQLQDVDLLLEKCKQFDGNCLPIYEHILREERPLESTILYYNQQQLVGFLSAFLFYENGCEISLFVCPQMRNKGIAKQLLKHVLPILQTESIEILVFTTVPTQLNTWLTAHDFQYQNSQYEMLRNTQLPFELQNNGLLVRNATAEDIPNLYLLDTLCFSEHDTNMDERFQGMLDNIDYHLYVAELGPAIIGKAHAHRINNKIRFSDIAIHPEMQGKGFGSRLLMACINDILSTGISNILLDVETKNQNALRLYTNLGFFITNSCDYWAISLQTISQFT